MDSERIVPIPNGDTVFGHVTGCISFLCLGMGWIFILRDCLTSLLFAFGPVLSRAGMDETELFSWNDRN